MVSTFGLIIEQNPDDVNAHDPSTRDWVDPQELGRIEFDSAAEDIEIRTTAPFLVESQIQEFAASMDS